MTEVAENRKGLIQWAIGQVLTSLEAFWTGLEEFGKSPESPTTSSELNPGQTIMQLETLKLICEYCQTQNATTAQSCIACGGDLPKTATHITPIR